VDLQRLRVGILVLNTQCKDLKLAFAPFRLSGNVYGVLLNHVAAYAALQSAMVAPPYKDAPRAPVLYIKPPTCLASNGDDIRLPDESSEVHAGATVGLIIGHTACRVSEQSAMQHVAGLTLVNDFSLPHNEFFRPAVRLNARDGYCPLGTATPLSPGLDPDRLTICVKVDADPTHTYSTADLRRSARRLLVDVTEFMTLSPGDLLLLGAMWPLQKLHAGQTVTLRADGLGELTNRVARGRP
jgi:5-oxopent-3-ene-1,2,5-tricarboxylate decarboxylase/2-hydroxyhepta-2,4-diene-1,7-dioate isomerase